MLNKPLNTSFRVGIETDITPLERNSKVLYRESEIKRAIELLTSQRAVVFEGDIGVGKTTLMLEFEEYCKRNDIHYILFSGEIAKLSANEQIKYFDLMLRTLKEKPDALVLIDNGDLLAYKSSRDLAYKKLKEKQKNGELLETEFSLLQAYEKRINLLLALRDRKAGVVTAKYLSSNDVNANEGINNSDPDLAHIWNNTLLVAQPIRINPKLEPTSAVALLKDKLELAGIDISEDDTELIRLIVVQENASYLNLKRLSPEYFAYIRSIWKEEGKRLSPNLVGTINRMLKL